MDRRTQGLFAFVLAIVIALTGGAALLLSETRAPSDPNAPAGTTAVIGAIVAVDGQGLADVRGFTLRKVGGDLLVFDLRALENATEFPPGHLAEHQATAEAVRVWYREEGQDRLAIRLEDAGS